MRVLNDFYCPTCGSTNEYFLENDLSSTTCQECGGDARKVLSPVNFQLEGISGDFPTASDKWAKKRDQKIAQENFHNS